MIVQNTSLHGTTDISFTVPGYDLAVSTEVAEALVRSWGHRGHHRRRRGPGVAGRGGDEDPPRRHRADLRDPGRRRHQHRDDLDLVDPDLVHGAGGRAEEAVRALHAAFELG